MEFVHFFLKHNEIWNPANSDELLHQPYKQIFTARVNIGAIIDDIELNMLNLKWFSVEKNGKIEISTENPHQSWVEFVCSPIQ